MRRMPHHLHPLGRTLRIVDPLLLNPSRTLLHLQSLEADHPHHQIGYLLHLSTQSKTTKTRLLHLLDLLNRSPPDYLKVLLDLLFHSPIEE